MGFKFIVVVLALALAGCAGPRVRSEMVASVASSPQTPLVEANDSRIAIALERVVIRNGPGSWASDAAWDEYQFRIRSTSGEELRLTRITLFDALDQPVESSADRALLIDATAEVERRYEKSGHLARSASGGNWTVVAGVAGASVATGLLVAGASYTPGVFLAGPAANIAGMAAGFALGSTILVAAAAERMASNSRIASALERRRSLLPATIGSADSTITAFFPIVPLPRALEVAYLDGAAERVARISTTVQLAQAHVPSETELLSRAEPKLPAGGTFRRDNGHVKARLSIDPDGSVSSVEILEATSEMLVPEAKVAFLKYRYTVGSADRSAEATMRFRRDSGR